MGKLIALVKLCKKSQSSVLQVVIRYLFYKFKGKSIIAHEKAIIKGLRNIKTHNLLNIGVDYVGFTHNKDVTYLNINGTLEVFGRFIIGRGCRFDVGKNALVKLGDQSSINPFSKLIIMHALEIGNNCSISWNCQFLDEDFHNLHYEDKTEQVNKGIIIGDKVWIGCNVSLYKGAVIPKGCVIASNSVVKSKFEEENVLIAGNPAKIIKRNVIW